MGVKCNCTVSRQKEKRIRKQNLRGGRIVMPMFPFFFFFFFFFFFSFFFPLPSTSGPGPKVPRRTPCPDAPPVSFGPPQPTNLRNNKFTHKHSGQPSGPTIIEGHQPSSSRRLTNPKTPLILKSNFKNAPPTHTFLLFFLLFLP